MTSEVGRLKLSLICMDVDDAELGKIQELVGKDLTILGIFPPNKTLFRYLKRHRRYVALGEPFHSFWRLPLVCCYNGRDARYLQKAVKQNKEAKYYVMTDLGAATITNDDDAYFMYYHNIYKSKEVILPFVRMRYRFGDIVCFRDGNTNQALYWMVEKGYGLTFYKEIQFLPRTLSGNAAPEVPHHRPPVPVMNEQDEEEEMNEGESFGGLTEPIPKLTDLLLELPEEEMDQIMNQLEDDGDAENVVLGVFAPDPEKFEFLRTFSYQLWCTNFRMLLCALPFLPWFIIRLRDDYEIIRLAIKQTQQTRYYVITSLGLATVRYDGKLRFLAFKELAKEESFIFTALGDGKHYNLNLLRFRNSYQQYKFPVSMFWLIPDRYEIMIYNEVQYLASGAISTMTLLKKGNSSPAFLEKGPTFVSPYPQVRNRKSKRELELEQEQDQQPQQQREKGEEKLVNATMSPDIRRKLDFLPWYSTLKPIQRSPSQQTRNNFFVSMPEVEKPRAAPPSSPSITTTATAGSSSPTKLNFSWMTLRRKGSTVVEDELPTLQQLERSETPLSLDRHASMGSMISASTRSTRPVPVVIMHELGAGCYLFYDTINGGAVYKQWSLDGKVLNNPIAHFVPTAKVPKFRYTQNWGRSDLVKAGGDKKKLCEGVALFIKEAIGSSDAFTFLGDDMVEAYGFKQKESQVIKFLSGGSYESSSLDAVAVVPNGNLWFHGMKTTSKTFFLSTGNRHGHALTI